MLELNIHIIWKVYLEDKFFVYNQEQKSATFFMIPNILEETEQTTLEFIDLIQT